MAAASAAEKAPSHNESSATGTETVTVACKIPQGMHCVIYSQRKITEAIPGGSREVTQSFQTEKSFTIAGPAHGQNEGPRVRTVMGFALTEGIRKDLWDEWHRQNASLPAVINGLVSAYSSYDRAADGSRENIKAKTGLERLNPNALPQIDPRFAIKTAEDAVAQIGRIDE